MDLDTQTSGFPTPQPLFRHIACALCLACFLLPARVQAQDWWPLAVQSFYGEYDIPSKVQGQPAGSLRGPVEEFWSPPMEVSRPYTVGVAFPHLKDDYWLAVNYGIVSEARRLGLGVQILEAGGYGDPAHQAEQLRVLARRKVDGLILAAVSYSGLDHVISEITAEGIPVVEVINDIRAPDISAKALVSFYNMGHLAGRFVAEQAQARGIDPVRVLFLPGPKDSGWAPESLQGFKAAMDSYEGRAQVLDELWGDTGKGAQTALIRQGLADHPDLDFLVGNAVAADMATDLLRSVHRADDVTVVSTYITPPLYEKIRNGTVAAAPADLAAHQGMMAVNMLALVLEGATPGEDFPFRSGPRIPVVTPKNIDRFPYVSLFGPRNFTPVLMLRVGE